MATTIRLEKTGAAEVLHSKTFEPAKPGPTEAWLVQEAVGVNYLDVTQRNGAVPIPLPGGLGLEGTGRVAAVGRDVRNVSVGDRVAYASERAYPAERLVRLPDSLSPRDSAAVIFKGVTAQYLLQSTYPVGSGTVVLLYGMAGALGQLMVPQAKHLEAFVIGVVSKEASIEVARRRGCDEVLVWGSCDLAKEVAALTDGRKVDAVYDGIGRATFEASLDSLRPRGLMVSIGACSGAPDPVAVGTLNAKGSLFLIPATITLAGGTSRLTLLVRSGSPLPISAPARRVRSWSSTLA